MTTIVIEMPLILWNIVLIILLIRRVDNKAMMIEPPHRSSLWRYDKTVPVNTKDDMLNCGGYEVRQAILHTNMSDVVKENVT